MGRSDFDIVSFFMTLTKTMLVFGHFFESNLASDFKLFVFIFIFE